MIKGYKRILRLAAVFTSAGASFLFLTVCLGCAESPEEKRLYLVRSGEERLNVVLISIDTLRADALGCYGGDIAETPNIDRLAAEGTLFTECKAPVPLTLPSHTTMLTGTSPPYNGVRNNDVVVSPDLVFLPEVLREHGYRTAGIIGGFPLDDVFGFDQGFDYYDDDFTRGQGTSLVKFETPADVLVPRCKKWLAENEKEPFFLFVHFFDPHKPYTPLIKYYDRYKDNLYYGEVALVDEAVGAIVKALEREGLSDNTLVILTADHGESLGEHGELTHGFFVYETTQHVPLIFYCPGLIPQGRVVGGAINIADICPTVLDVLGIELPESIQGESLVPYLYRKSKAERTIYEETFFGADLFGWSQLYALEKDGWKYVDAPSPELYNLSEDPGELANLFDKNPSRAARMSENLKKIKTRLAENGISETGPVTLSDRDKARLETLGYLSAGGGGVTAERGADPKDKTEYIGLYNDYYPSDVEHHVKVLSRMIEIEPGIAFPYNKLGSLYATFGDYDEAETLLKKALELQPTYNEARLNLADLYLSVRKYDEADELLGKVEKDPSTALMELAKAYYARGNLITAARGSPDAAMEYYEKAIDVQKEYAAPYYAIADIYLKKLGDERKAKEYARKFLELEPRGEEAARMRALLGQEPVEELAAKANEAYDAGDYEKAVELCRRAAELDPSYYEMRYNLACCLALAGRGDEAVSELKALTRDTPGVFDEALTRDPDLDSLRGRDDFKKLLE
jgi:arylsulfatase A-like enzyme/Flp pilus assembly protein TadD